MTFGTHLTDTYGNPAGGSTMMRGIAIMWQNGLVVGEPNGAFVEDVIAAAIDRLVYYQSTEFACRRNEKAIKHLKRSLKQLRKRTKERKARGVENTHET
jgi:hypothetical protein